MEIPRHIGDQEVANSERQAARRHSMKVRWQRVRRMRLKTWLFFVALPVLVFVVFCVLEVGVESVVQLAPGLSLHDRDVYGLAAQIATAIVFVAAGSLQTADAEGEVPFAILRRAK